MERVPHPFPYREDNPSAMKDQSEEARTRAYWLKWIGYIMRDHESNEIDFMQILAPGYQKWAEQILGEPRPLHQYAILPCDYLRLAVRAAPLAKLQELYAIRYILQHPVRDGVPYRGNCNRVPVLAFRLTRVRPTIEKGKSR